MPLSDWIRDDLGNALSDLNLTAVRGSFQKNGAVVFGFHYHYYGGAARTMVVFGSAEDLIGHMTDARPGDHFTLFDLDSVAAVASLHLGVAKSGDVIPFTRSDRIDLDRIASESPWRATILIQRSTEPAGDVTLCSILEREPAEFTTNWEMFREYAVQATWPRGAASISLGEWSGEVYAFDESDLDRDMDRGEDIVTVTAKGARRTRALVDAKRPDEQGLVPVSGAY